jgi:ParB family chromosome partitioning protein
MGNLNNGVQKYISISEESEMFFAPIDKVHEKEGFNPRKNFNKEKRSAMRESVREHGVQVPIIVRPHPTIKDEFETAAGHTRRILTIEVERDTIPVICRNLTDEQMEEIALIENTQREDMSPIDEGNAAKAILQRNGGDKEDVRKTLGWSAAKLDSRMQLTYATQCVAEALSNKTIKLGHAELLSGLRETAQEAGLNMVIDNKMSVDELRKRIAKRSLEIKLAIFDTNDCNTCQHNTTPQANLFETGHEAGKCLNAVCYNEKTSKALTAKKEELSESYQVIKLSGEIANDTTVSLCPSGDQGVGLTQLDNCTTCAKNGAVISEQLGSLGVVSKNVCFDLTCHKKKVGEYQQIVKVPTKIVEPVKSDQSVDKNKKNSPIKSVKKTAPPVASTPKIIIEKNHKVHRIAAAHFVSQNAIYAKALGLIGVMKDSGLSGDKLREIGSPSIGPIGGLNTEGRKKLLNTLITWSEADVDFLLQKVVCESVRSATSGFADTSKPETDVFGAAALSILETTKTTLNDHFCMENEYLKHHTKPAIKVILKDAGFDKSYLEKNGEKSFDKLMNEKKPDLLKLIQEHEFDWKGFIPATMTL